MMVGMTTPQTFGMRLKRAREKARLTQVQLAAAIGVTQKTIDNWEHDKAFPRSAIGALEDVLGVSLTGNGPEPEPEPDNDEDIEAAAAALRESARKMVTEADRLAAKLKKNRNREDGTQARRRETG